LHENRYEKKWITLIKYKAKWKDCYKDRNRILKILVRDCKNLGKQTKQTRGNNDKTPGK
jgi:hypothetical protein